MRDDSNPQGVDGRDSTSDRSRRPWSSRRGVLKAAATVGSIVAIGVPAAAQEATYELGGQVPGWMGRAPAAIEGETNPTLTFEAGTTVVVEWENVDGQPHNFVVEDDQGTHLVETEIIEQQGATQTVEFEATPAMTMYYCSVHPETMRGEVSVREAPMDGQEEPPVGDGGGGGRPSDGDALSRLIRFLLRLLDRFA